MKNNHKPFSLMGWARTAGTPLGFALYAVAVLGILGLMFTAGHFAGRTWVLAPVAPVNAYAGQVPTAPVDTAAMTEPVVMIASQAVLVTIDLKPEYLGPHPWASTWAKVERLMEIPAGATQLVVDPAKDELFTPAVWVQDGAPWCLAPPARLWALKGLDEEFSVPMSCKGMFSLVDGDGTALIQTARVTDVTAQPGRYIFQVDPADVVRYATATFPVYRRLLEPFLYDLQQFEVGAPNVAEKVIIQKHDIPSAATGFFAFNGPVQIRHYAQRWASSGDLSWGFQYEGAIYREQTLVLTNAHVVGNLMDDTVYGITDPEHGNVVHMQRVVAAEMFVRLNPDGAWLGAKVVAVDPELDMALVALNEPLPKTPQVNWLPAPLQLAAGDEVYVVGHPLAIGDDIITRGVVGVVAHKPAGVASGPYAVPSHLVQVDAEGGSSGSPAYLWLDMVPYVSGILFASYGTPTALGDGPRCCALGNSDEVKWMFNHTPFTVAPPQDADWIMAAGGFASARLKLIRTIDQIADFMFTSGVDIPALTARFEF